MLNCDKYFILELQKNGFDIDYNKLTGIYRESRKHPGVQKRKRENAALNAAMFGDK